MLCQGRGDRLGLIDMKSLLYGHPSILAIWSGLEVNRVGFRD